MIFIVDNKLNVDYKGGASINEQFDTFYLHNLMHNLYIRVAESMHSITGVQ